MIVAGRTTTRHKATVAIRVTRREDDPQALGDILRMNTKFLELVFCGFTMGWGLWLLMPWMTFEGKPSFDFMARIAREEYWGGLAVFIATLRFVGIWKRSWHCRLVASLMGFSFWLAVTISIGWKDPSSTGIPAYGFYCLLNGHVFLRILDGRPRGEQ